MRVPPLASLCVMLVIGIAVGYSTESPSFLLQHGVSLSTLSASFVLLLLLASTLLRRYDRCSTALLLGAVFCLGIFLIKGERHTYAVPFYDDIAGYMENKRSDLVESYRQCGLDGDEFSVVTAMTLGERQYVSHSLRNSYNISGAAHVFALSGMHLGIIFMLLTMLTPRRLVFGMGRTYRFMSFLLVLLQVVTLWTYVMLVGARPSIMRAAVMLTVYAICRQMARRPDNLSVLFFTLFMMLVVWPEWLFDVGFQMSFMAVGSIALLYKPLNAKLLALLPFKWYRTPLRILSQTMLLSTCAQIGVAPLIALYFHRFSTYFLLTNLPVPLLATFVIYLSILMLVCAAMPFAYLTTAGAWLLQHVAYLLNHYLAWIATLPYASIEGIYINKAQTIIIYVIMACACMLVYHLYHGLRRRLGEVYSA